jgi:flagella basal body P-ring formation protein FlgA
VKEMGKKVCLVILLQLCFWLSSVFAEGMAVTISEQAKIDGAVMTLGDLAQINGDNTERVQSLRQLKLGAAPLPGSSFVLTKDVINMRLGATGADLSGIDWQIPNNVTVIGNSQLISGQLLIDKAVTTIRSQVGADIGIDNLTISPVGQVQDVVAPPGDVVLNASLLYGIHYNMPTTVIASVNINGRAYNKVGLRFDVKLYRQVAVAARTIDAGEIVSDDCVRYERMDSGRLAAGFVTDKSKIIGLMTRRQVTPGTVITDSMVNRPAIVKRGSMVTLLARMGNMEVTTAGQAMQDGCEGQLIRVLNVNSKKVVFGKILNDSTVQVLTYNGSSSSQ